ncbi:MAG: peroxidase family protein [Planctomycetota bacterium]
MDHEDKHKFDRLEDRWLMTSGLELPGCGAPTNPRPDEEVEFASIDGSGNNLQNPDWGSTGTELLRIADAEYSDGYSTPAGDDRPSAREISNALADQGGEDIISDRFLSAMIYAWGQFIDHDLDLTQGGTSEYFPVQVPTGDPWFDPAGTGTNVIPLVRSAYDPDSGTDPSNPREQVNLITAWLDGSMIYGSNSATATALRTLSGGRLKTSDGYLLPLNNVSFFPDATLPMSNDAHRVSDEQLFAAGDVRANENVELTALHTLFVREHNYWADRIASEQPSLSDEEIYLRARQMVIAELQSITYNEWLPAVLGKGALDRYHGYDATVNPGLSNEFATAGFRVGHSLLGDDVEFLDNNGRPIADEVPLSEAFSNPALVSQHGIDSILKYLASDPASELDVKVVESVRNFLFGPPGSGGLDLASLNIQRGRDHGLADYNQTREAYGLTRVASFSDITSDEAVQAKLADLYGSVDNIDLWVGCLAEDHVRGGSVGETLQAIISDQFERLRDGDRFWYQHSLSAKMVRQVESTSLADIIRRNTELNNLQENAFFFRASVSGTAFGDSNLNGRLDGSEKGIAGVTVQLVSKEDGSVVATTITNAKGEYSFDVADGLRTGEYQLRVVAPGGSSGSPKGQTPLGPSISVTRGEQSLDRVHLAIPAASPNAKPQPPAPPKNNGGGPKPHLPTVQDVRQATTTPNRGPAVNQPSAPNPAPIPRSSQLTANTPASRTSQTTQGANRAPAPVESATQRPTGRNAENVARGVTPEVTPSVNAEERRAAAIDAVFSQEPRPLRRG